jgi:hypothetical protein
MDKLKQLTIENLQYGKPRPYPPKQVLTCKASKVEPRHDLSDSEEISRGVPTWHAGVITHVCWEEKGHEDEYCKCPCGHQWRMLRESVSQRRISE